MNKLNNELTFIPQAHELLKPSGLIKSSHTLSLMEHKIFNTLLKMGIERKTARGLVVETTFDEIRSLYGGEIENKQIRATMKSLQRSIIEVYGVKEDGKEWDISGQYLGTIAFEKGNSLVKYDFSSVLIDALIQKYQYARLDLQIISSLKSKYSVIFYELLTDYKNIGSVAFSIDDLKKFCGLEEKDTDFKTMYFKNRVLDKAVKEINKKTPFNLSYDVKKSGVKIIGITLVFASNDKLKLSPNQNREMFREWLKVRYCERRIDLKNGTAIVIKQNKSGDFLIYHNTTNKPIPTEDAKLAYNELFEARKMLFKKGIELGYFSTEAKTYDEDFSLFLQQRENSGSVLVEPKKTAFKPIEAKRYVYANEAGEEFELSEKGDYDGWTLVREGTNYILDIEEIDEEIPF